MFISSTRTWTHRQTEEDLRERYDDEEGPVEALVLHEVSDEGDGLDRFSQTHLISQDAIQVVVVKRHQPLQTFDLQRDGSKF